MPETPRFHHLHLNSLDPEGAIDFYLHQFASTSRTAWAGFPALASPNNVLILFNQVPSAPAVEPDTAIWHFGWHVTDVRGSLETYRGRGGLALLPLYTGEADNFVHISSDSWPGAGGTLGRTRHEIAEARRTGLQPKLGPGFAYLQGPDSAIVEYAGDHPSERFNHVHMWQEQPICAQVWYQQHLNASLLPGAPSADGGDCSVTRGVDRSFPALDPDGMFRKPSGGVAFGDVWLPWYMRQGDQPLAATRGHLYDHFALAVADLDTWRHRLEASGVTFLEDVYVLGDTRAMMICGPSQEAIELVEVRGSGE